MADLKAQEWQLSDRDLDFVIEAAAPQFSDKAKLKHLIREDDAFRKGLIGDEKVFAKVIEDESVMLRISPSLYFEILLRRALKELEKASHTVERSGARAIPVFDTKEVVVLLTRQSVLEYLATMLSSFTKIESYVIPVRVRKGVWRKIRFNDLDVDSLVRIYEATDEEHRFVFLKRIADVCLFISGIFPEYARLDRPYPFSGMPRSATAGRTPRGVEDYEEEGRRFYRLAAEHEAAKNVGLSNVFWLLHDNFNAARKPLAFISDHYLHHNKHELFGLDA